MLQFSFYNAERGDSSLWNERGHKCKNKIISNEEYTAKTFSAIINTNCIQETGPDYCIQRTG